tara:strand:- start:9 stop:842 length:834 start_codon:yes stop_codon:yes gene_type:complete
MQKQNTKNLTVIISVYNNADTISETMDSIFNQTYSDFDIFCVDDASTDETLTILEGYARKDSRLNIIRNEKCNGLAANLNVMLNKASGDYIARMDGDDICLPTRFEKQIAFMEANPKTDILGTAAIVIDEVGKETEVLQWPVSHENIVKVIWANPIIHPSVMFRCHSIRNIGGYPLYRRRQDYALWFTAAKNGLHFANLEEPLLKYRVIKNHYKKTPRKDHFLQLRLGWKGYASMGGINPKIYLFIAWPFVRSFMPSKIQNAVHRKLRKLDPRRKTV